MRVPVSHWWCVSCGQSGSSNGPNRIITASEGHKIAQPHHRVIMRLAGRGWSVQQEIDVWTEETT